MMSQMLPNLWPDRWRISAFWPGDSRKLMRRSVLRLLAVAHEERLDTAMLIANLADEHRGANRRLLLRLARRLSSGLPLVAALEQTPEVLSDHQVLAIRFASQTGTLPATYQDLIREGEASHTTVDRDLRHSALYFAAMVVVLIWIISFLAVFIYPILDQLITELEMGEPPSSYAFIDWWYRQAGLIGLSLPAAVLGVIAILWVSPWGGRLRRRLADSRLHWVRKLRVAELLEMLAQSVSAGRPLGGALSTLARYHFDKTVRLRLLFVRNEIEQGANVWESLHDSGLLSAGESQALSASSSPTSQAWLMRRLAGRRRQQAIAFAEGAARLLQAITVLVVAAMVLLFTSAAYQYLAYFVYQLS